MEKMSHMSRSGISDNMCNVVFSKAKGAFD